MSSAPPVVGHLVNRLDRAGADRLAAEVAHALAERFRFVFLSLGPTGALGQRLLGQDHKVVQLRHRPLSPITPMRIRRAVRRYGITLLHTHRFNTHVLACAARAGSTHPPLIHTDHTRGPHDGPHPLRTLLHKTALRPNDQITAVAEHVKDALVEFDGLPAHRVTVIPNGIDPHRFDHTDDDHRRVARQLLGVDDPERVVIQVARFAPEKDHPTALRAFARVHDQLPQIRLVFIGDGPTRAAVEQQAWDLGVADHTYFLGWRDDVDALLPGADVFCLPSLAEGISPTILEAMASRLPVVATAVGGTAEAVVHGQTGLLSPPRDVHALAHNLLVLLKDSGLRQRMGDAGRQRVLQSFTRQKMLDAYAALYTRVLEQSAR